MTYRSVYIMDRDIPEARATSNNSGKANVDFRRALIPISLGVFFVLHFYFAVPLWALMCLTLWIPLFYLGVPMYTKHRWTNFEREFAYKFPQQDYRGLLSLYKKQWFLRQFGPKAMMLGKLGLIYSAMGRFRDAERILEGAVRYAKHGNREKFMLNLAHVKYELGKYKDAQRLYQYLLKRTPHLSGASTRIALIQVHTGSELHTSLEYLEKELPHSSGEDHKRILEAIKSAKSQLSS